MEMLREKIESLSAQPNSNLLNEVVETLGDKLYRAAKTCETKLTPEVTPIHSISPAMRAANEMLNLHTSGLCMWGDWDDTRRVAVRDINRKHCANLIQHWKGTLMTNDLKEIWNKIGWDGCSTDEEVFGKLPEIENLAEQFKSKDSSCEENLLDLQFGENVVPMLDQEVSLNEIKSVSTKLRDGKSTADGWAPKMLTEVNEYCSRFCL